MEVETLQSLDELENKITEIEFFLHRITDVEDNVTELKHYLNRFIISFDDALSVLGNNSDIPGYSEWAISKKEKASFSAEYNFFSSLKEAITEDKKFRDFLACIPLADIKGSALDYFLLILNITYEVYSDFGCYVDTQQHYTKEHYLKLNKNIDDAELEIGGWVMTDLINEGYDEDERWDELRSHLPECQLNKFFYSYLAKCTPQPKLPEHIEEIQYTPEERGWLIRPAGYSSTEQYWAKKLGLSLEEIKDLVM